MNSNQIRAAADNVIAKNRIRSTLSTGPWLSQNTSTEVMPDLVGARPSAVAPDLFEVFSRRYQDTIQQHQVSEISGLVHLSPDGVIRTHTWRHLEHF
jgi:hypothetical protein